MTGLLQDLRYGLRMMARSPGVTAAALVALALGIGANTAIFSIVDGILLEPLPYPDPDRLVAVYQVWTGTPGVHDVVGEDDFVELRAAAEEGATGRMRLAAYTTPSGGFALSDGAEPERVRGTQATVDLFDVLGERPLLGRGFLPEDDRADAPEVVVLSHALWQRRFGADPAVIGRSIGIDGKQHTVVGVMPPGFRFPRNRVADLWTRLRLERSDSRPPYYISAIARLEAGATPGAVRGVLDAATRRVRERFPDAPSDWSYQTGPLKKELVGDVGPALYVLLGAVALVLLIATANIANLLLARATARRREMAVRAALGAGRARLVRQVLVESLVLAAAGGLLGVVLALWATDLVATVLPVSLPRVEEIGVDRAVLLYTALVTTLSGLLFGLAPAAQVARTRLAGMLKEGGLGTTDAVGRRLRDALVVAEFALAVVLLVGAGLLLRSFVRLQEVNPGVAADHVLTASVSLPAGRYEGENARRAFFTRLVDDLESRPGIDAAAVAMALPPDLLVMTNPYTVEGQPPAPGQSAPAVPQLMVSPAFFRVLGVPLQRGRVFTAADTEGAPRVMLINDVMARQVFPGEDPIGRRMQLGEYDPGGSWVTIVGVVGDVKYSGLDKEPHPTMYTPYAQDAWWPAMYVAVRSPRDPDDVAQVLRSEVAAIDPTLPVAEVHTMSALVVRSVSEPRFRTALLGLFAAVALLLAAVGVYGVLAYTVGQRTREIGLRMALGACRRDVVALVLRQGMRLAGAGAVVGVAGAWALSRFLAGLLYGVGPSDPATFLAVVGVMCAVALLACWLPARRAAAVDPMVALRCE